VQYDLSDLNSRIDALEQQNSQESGPDTQADEQDQLEHVGDDLRRFADALKSIAAAGYSFGRDIPDVYEIDIDRGWWQAEFDRGNLYGFVKVKAIWHGHLGYHVHAESGTRRDVGSHEDGTHSLPGWVHSPDMHFDEHVKGDDLEATAAKAVTALAHIIHRTRAVASTPTPDQPS
jgi:hypothetical protein